MTTPIPVTLLSGTLGAGKTTLLNHILTSDHEYNIAVVINDIGEINVDANLIERHIEDDDLIELSNGCICCSMQSDLEQAIINLATNEKFDYLLIEPSGMGNPKPVAEQLIKGRPAGFYHLHNIVTVVDARNFYDEFAKGIDDNKTNSEKGKPISNLIAHGIEFCNKIIINKVDLINNDEINDVVNIVKKIQPEADPIVTEFGKIEASEILNTSRINPQEVANSPKWKQVLNEEQTKTKESHNADVGHSHKDNQNQLDVYGIDTFVYQCHRPMHPVQFAEALRTLPDEIIRIKGLLHIAGIEDYALNLSVAGNHAYVDVSGRWIASLSEYRQKNYRQNREIDWDSNWGDRRTEIVVIGRGIDVDSIKKILDGCVHSEYKSKNTDFENPFPKREGESINF